MITHVNDQPIADDCTLAFRFDERLNMRHAISGSQIGDSVKVNFLRQGEAKSGSYTLGLSLYNLPGMHRVDCWPSYFIYGALLLAAV